MYFSPNLKNILNMFAAALIIFCSLSLITEGYPIYYWGMAANGFSILSAVLLLCYINIENFSMDKNSILSCIGLVTMGIVLFGYKWINNMEENKPYLVLSILFLLFEALLIKTLVERLKIEKSK